MIRNSEIGCVVDLINSKIFLENHNIYGIQ